VRLTVDFPEDLVKIGRVLHALLPDSAPGLEAVLRVVEAEEGLPGFGPLEPSALVGAQPSGERQDPGGLLQ
jgi:hypothetical protein